MKHLAYAEKNANMNKKKENFVIIRMILCQLKAMYIIKLSQS